MEWPPPLHNGSKIALIAPARWVETEALHPFIEFVQQQGWYPVYTEGLSAREGVLAGDDRHRLAFLQKALNDPTIAAVWFVRGGYGTSRLWRYLSWELFKRYPKWLIGFSDITPLLWGAAKVGIVSLHAPVAVQVPHRVSADTLGYLLKILTSERFEVTLSWSWQPWYAWRAGSALGKLLGGNLSLLETLCGTSLDIKGWDEQSILFWEEVGEYNYRIDRLSWHLNNAGWYDRAEALLIGGVTGIQDDEDAPFGRTLREIVWESTPSHLPIAMGLPIGHVARNLPLPVGAQASLIIEEKQAQLRFWRG
ncbi:MAG: LD-carboxypeptidase [Bacteroidia bacterium]|nr:LD-carboxypeptidase [Bacteroidia bacterium]